ncbi:unnamed protein product [Cyprideis torosa]|uniref:Teneurin-1-4-like galactose-binding domain-containing protein n=1 Tax=Cyprideis torosa TaxID=163714 RepID=A0A7R8WGF5_9CRUS|nr:unnamed protein product [Cyprideis torosa]CAG0895257.1 unnamed protein product [Cyprideis torosa]
MELSSSPAPSTAKLSRCEGGRYGTAPFGTTIPVVPVHRHNHSSHWRVPSRSNSRYKISEKCSWKLAALVLVLLCVLLSATVAYLAASGALSNPRNCANSCPIIDASMFSGGSVDTNLISSQSGVGQRPSEQQFQQSDPAVPTSSSQQTPSESSQTANALAPQHRNNLPAPSSPPDGTSFLRLEVGKPLRQIVPSYGYWSLQFFLERSEYLNFLLTVPKGSSFGVYARKNALPTLTRHDFMEILGANREKREASLMSKPDSGAKYPPLFETISQQSFLASAIRTTRRH